MLAYRQLPPKRPWRQKSGPISADDSLPPSPFHTISLEDPQLKTKTSRAGKPKVRTGCITCKIRRVKCDEARPFCNRCVKFGTVCDGYLQSFSRPFVSARREVILPKGTSIVLRPCELPQIFPAPSGSCFEDEYESRFFSLYVCETAAQLAGPFKTSLWSRLIPQACEAEPYIRQVVAGIGALSQVCKADSSADAYDKRKLYEYALKEYDKALRGMRDAITNGKHNIRHALLACLLVFCFESLQGDPTSAAKNARGGLLLLEEWISSQGSSDLSRDFPSSQRRAAGFYGLEIDILQAFSALDIQVLFFLDTRTESQHFAFVEQFMLAIRHRMPSCFQTLEECRDFWVFLQRRNCHFNNIALDALKSGAKPQEQHGVNDIDIRKGQWSTDKISKEEMGSSLSQEMKESLRAQMESYREDLRRWSQASAAVFAHVEKEGTQDEQVIMAVMKIHALLSHVQLAAAFMTSDLEYDSFLPEYTSIVELSEDIYPFLASSGAPSKQSPNQNLNTGHIFRFDLGVIYPLSSVGFRCRNSKVRGRAIALLKRSPYREGIWDSQTVGCLTDWIRGIEEQGMDENGYISEESRAVMTLCDVDLKNKSAMLGCTSKGRNNGPPIFRTERVEWRFDVGDRERVLKLGEDDRYLARFRG